MRSILKKLSSSLTVVAVGLSLFGTPSTQAAVVDVSGHLTGTNTWTADNEYVLNGFVYVLTNSVLQIEAGTVIRGRAGTGLDAAALFITQGAKIYANGTAERPIIFTAEDDDLSDPEDIPLYTRNLWGGVVLFGRATLNTASDVSGNAATPKYDVFEGLPDTEVNGQYVNRFGGEDDDDDSGVLRYVSIRYSSVTILPNKEINALSLCGVGRGTTVEYVECFGAGDDSVEFFGGAVNTKYMVSIFSDDDNFDIDQGYHGKNQFWFVLQAPDRKDNGGEWNGEPSGLAAGNEPVGDFEIYNATYVGAGTEGTGARAFIARENAAPNVFNSIWTEFNLGVNIDDKSAVHFADGVAKFQNNILWNFASNGVAQAYWQNANGEAVLTNEANANLFVDPLLTGISRTNVPAQGLDPRPQAGSPALSSPVSAPDDGFYSPVNYRGAFGANDLWIAGWTFASQVGLVAPAPAGPQIVTQPTPTLEVYPRQTVTLSVVASGQGTLSYQWLKNGTALEGATGAQLTLADVQPGDDGTYTVTVTDSAGSVTSNPSVVTVTYEAYEDWATRSGLSGAGADLAADPDNDGIVNLIEYAFGGNPNGDSSGHLPAAVWVDVAGTTHPGLTYTRNKTGVGGEIQVRAAGDVSFAAPINLVLVGVADLGDGTERLTWRTEAPVADDSAVFWLTQVAIP